MNKTNKYSPEVKERAVRLVQEHRSEYPSLWSTIESIAPKIGCAPPTLHDWVKKHEIDTGLRDGVTSEEREQVMAYDDWRETTPSERSLAAANAGRKVIVVTVDPARRLASRSGPRR